MDAEGLSLIIETEADRLAERAVEVYSDEAKWKHASRMGLELIGSRFSATGAGEALMDSIAAGRRLRTQDTVWKHVAYAALEQRKNRHEAQDFASRTGRKVTGVLQRLRSSRNPVLQSLIKLLRGRGTSR